MSGWSSLAKAIGDLELEPGETQSYSISNVIVPENFPYHYPLHLCFSVLRQDNHADDNPYDNHSCKKIEFTGNTPFGSSRIHYFPNPADERLFFANRDKHTFDVLLYDQKGSQVMNSQSFSVDYPHLDISSLASGLYYLEFIFGDGQIETGKFLKL